MQRAELPKREWRQPERESIKNWGGGGTQMQVFLEGKQPCWGRGRWTPRKMLQDVNSLKSTVSKPEVAVFQKSPPCP